MSSIPIDASDPTGRMGVPADRLGAVFVPVNIDEKRTAVIVTIVPPEALRDASRETIRAVIRAQGLGILDGISEEIFKSYTSDPLDATAARNIATAMTQHADSLGEPR